MDNLNNLPDIYNKFMLFALIFMRIASLLWTFNLFRHELITGRLVYALAAMLAVYVLFLNNPGAVNYDMFSIKMLINGSLQVFIGFVGGLILNIVFDAFLGVGQIASTQIGLGLASLIDPRLGSITTLAHFYMITATLIFLFLNGHLFIIQTIIGSFDVIPVGKLFLPTTFMHDAVGFSSVIFSGAIMLSLTIVLTMLLTNISLAVMTKFAPQFNIFSVGIGITLIIGLFCLYFNYQSMLDDSFNFMRKGLEFFQHSFIKMK